MEIQKFIELLDFDSFDYFYHETDDEMAESIMEEGLLVEGTNIINTDNILFTTTLPITADMIENLDSFIEFLHQERSINPQRKVSKMVVLIAPKEYQEQIVEQYPSYVDETLYEGIVPSQFVMGMIDLETATFEANPECVYCDTENFITFKRKFLE